MGGRGEHIIGSDRYDRVSKPLREARPSIFGLPPLPPTENDKFLNFYSNSIYVRDLWTCANKKSRTFKHI